ncbi:MAG: LPP20 family lipoprotein [Rickettsiales bacterium]|jgi:hypothetical protein|nr:LPP20 family lipoprotein [Rickettsiales bacterium]
MFWVILAFIFQSEVLAGELPSWANNISEECPPNNFCAVGGGKSLEMAMSDARGNIQKIFATEIHNVFESKTESGGAGEVKSSAEEALREESSGILSGIVIAKTFQVKDAFYAFATFDKIAAAEKLKSKMEALDVAMTALLGDNSLSAVKELKENYEKRRELNEKYLFLMGSSLPEAVEYNQIKSQERKAGNNSAVFYLMMNDYELETIVKNLLANNGMKITKDKKLANRTIIGFLTFKREFLNVSGFEKYSADLKMDALENGVVKGTINTVITDTGINFDQIRSKTMKNLSKFIEDNFTNFID